MFNIQIYYINNQYYGIYYNVIYDNCNIFIIKE